MKHSNQKKGRLWFGLAALASVVVLVVLRLTAVEPRRQVVPDPMGTARTESLAVPPTGGPAPETSDTTTAVVVSPSEEEMPGESASADARSSAPKPAGERLPPMPRLDDSDDALRESLATVARDRGAGLSRLLVPSDLIRRFVVVGENVAAPRLPRRHMPVRPPAGRFRVVRRSDGRLIVDPRNAARYRPYVQALETLDPAGVAAVFRHYSPLFAEAWRALGRRRIDPERRLREAIDMLLAAPDVAGDVVVERHSVNYRFADPAIEALPESQRLLVRIGRENATRVKRWLRAVRAALIADGREGRR